MEPVSGEILSGVGILSGGGAQALIERRLAGLPWTFRHEEGQDWLVASATGPNHCVGVVINYHPPRQRSTFTEGWCTSYLYVGDGKDVPRGIRLHEQNGGATQLPAVVERIRHLLRVLAKDAFALSPLLDDAEELARRGPS